MPEIAKFLRQAKTPPHYVVVLPSVATQVGDSITGEEFICWSSLDSGKFSGTYVGTPEALSILRRYLEPTVPYGLNADQTAIERYDWLDTLYCPEPTPVGGVARIGSVEIGLEPGRVVILDGRQLLYDGYPTCSPDLDDRIDRFLDAVPRRGSANSLRVLAVGTGNGFGGNTSSSAMEIPGHRIGWIRHRARTRPSHGMRFTGDITDVLVTHIHEDHIGGSACLARARAKSQRLALWITRPSLAVYSSSVLLTSYQASLG